MAHVVYILCMCARRTFHAVQSIITSAGKGMEMGWNGNGEDMGMETASLGCFQIQIPCFMNRLQTRMMWWMCKSVLHMK